MAPETEGLFCDGCKHLSRNAWTLDVCARAEDLGSMGTWLGFRWNPDLMATQVFRSQACLDGGGYEPETEAPAQPVGEKITTDCPACPYCGDKWDDWYMAVEGSDGDTTVDCANCEREYAVRWSTTTTFTTKLAGEDATDAQE